MAEPQKVLKEVAMASGFSSCITLEETVQISILFLAIFLLCCVVQCLCLRNSFVFPSGHV